ncbi:U-box domain-containing protein 12-like [Juglans microcarpa x Juglans regia]|uniref:U-box domain-containing protein 12-like n=1 Tax=Juglans microcarpa x Juglans regia TaxID=2249226 RepID=UPI001B7E3F66|nr:U-box domain-containing protein 12-like [Juglans microcarpa x Juglans regia]
MSLCTSQRPIMPDSSSSSSPPPPCSPIWLLPHIKLHFFARIRRFLRLKAARKRCGSSGGVDVASSTARGVNNEVVVQALERESEDESAVLQRSVKKLHFGSWLEKEMAVKEIEKLAREDGKTRKFLAQLGVIPVLVAMAASEVATQRRVAVTALIELANGTYTNKALMLEAGILSKLPQNIDTVDELTRREFAELLLSLSSLANNTQFPLASSESTLPFLLSILQSSSSVETKELCLGTTYNISTVLDHAGALVSSGFLQTLLTLSTTKELSEKALATLGHLVVTLMGKKAMENSPMVPESLIEILTWEDKPKCQELSAYILMILGHQNSTQRERMAKSGIVQVLLEVSLLGSPLAQKRAIKLLQWFKDERQANMRPHSGPQTGRIAMGSPVNPREAQEGKKMMKNLVKQSLYKNMEVITRRANIAAVHSSSKLKALVISTSSKSLPY